MNTLINIFYNFTVAVVATVVVSAENYSSSPSIKILIITPTLRVTLEPTHFILQNCINTYLYIYIQLYFMHAVANLSIYINKFKERNRKMDREENKKKNY